MNCEVCMNNFRENFYCNRYTVRILTLLQAIAMQEVSPIFTVLQRTGVDIKRRKTNVGQLFFSVDPLELNEVHEWDFTVLTPNKCFLILLLFAIIEFNEECSCEPTLGNIKGIRQINNWSTVSLLLQLHEVFLGKQTLDGGTRYSRRTCSVTQKQFQALPDPTKPVSTYHHCHLRAA